MNTGQQINTLQKRKGFVHQLIIRLHDGEVNRSANPKGCKGRRLPWGGMQMGILYKNPEKIYGEYQRCGPGKNRTCI